MLAGVELGGTKCICILATGPDAISDVIEIPTTEPEPTLAAIRSTLAGWCYEALGIASFGPIDVNPTSRQYGAIVNTTKPGWSGTPLTHLAAGVPVLIDTDVNGAALAEGQWGAAQGLASWAYITVGTGVGVGSIIAGKPACGLGHSEAGHMRVPRSEGDSFAGNCPFHGDCVEGLASGPAIEARTGRKGRDLAADDPAWAYTADALALLCYNLALTSLPQRILIGGGVATGQPQLLPLIREKFAACMTGYGVVMELAGPLDRYIALPALGTMAGPLGAIALAQRAARSAN